MDNFSQSEIEFVKKCISKDVRLDGRSKSQARNESIERWNNSQADSSIRIVKGNSEIIINLVFRSSISTLKTLNMAQDIELKKQYTDKYIYSNGPLDVLLQNDNPNEFLVLKSNFREQNPCFPIIEKWLDSYNIGLEIELIEVGYDGNVFDMFFTGLKEMLKTIKIPDIKNLSSSIQSSLSIPRSTSFAWIENTLVKDPTLIEEKSSDGIVRVFENSNTPCSVIFEKFNNKNGEVKQIIDNIKKGFLTSK